MNKNILFMSKNQTLSVIHTQSKYQNLLKNDYKKDFGIFLTNNIQTIDKIFYNFKNYFFQFR